MASSNGGLGIALLNGSISIKSVEPSI